MRATVCADGSSRPGDAESRLWRPFRAEVTGDRTADRKHGSPPQAVRTVSPACRSSSGTTCSLPQPRGRRSAPSRFCSPARMPSGSASVDGSPTNISTTVPLMRSPRPASASSRRRSSSASRKHAPSRLGPRGRSTLPAPGGCPAHPSIRRGTGYSRRQALVPQGSRDRREERAHPVRAPPRGDADPSCCSTAVREGGATRWRVPPISSARPQTGHGCSGPPQLGAPGRASRTSVVADRVGAVLIPAPEIVGDPP